MQDIAPEMKITAIAPWFGSKRTLAPTIVQELGPHRAYWEPFCGSMAVLLAKPESGHETVNDLHGELVNLARVIQDTRQGSALYRRLRRVLTTEDARNGSAIAEPRSDATVERAFNYFVQSWMGRNGFCGTVGEEKRSFAVRWTPGGGHGGMRVQSAVTSIPAWRRRMRRVTVLNRDALEVIANIDDTSGVAIYVDPPYIKKAAEYVHDFDWLTHRKLAKELNRFTKARVVVSYYAHYDLAAMYPGWTIRDCSMNLAMHNGARRGGSTKVAPEVLLINGPSFAESR